MAVHAQAAPLLAITDVIILVRMLAAIIVNHPVYMVVNKVLWKKSDNEMRVGKAA